MGVNQETLLKTEGARYAGGDTAQVVALDRQEEAEDIVLRFLLKGPAFGSQAKEVRLNKGLAEQLKQLLEDELCEMSEQARLQLA
jgi:hypothetical protein